MTEYHPNPAVEFDWPAPAEAEAPLVARVRDDPGATVPVETAAVVEALSFAAGGRDRDELAAYLAEAASIPEAAAAERIDELLDADLLVADGTAPEARRWLAHGWRRSLYYHLSTRDRTADGVVVAAEAPLGRAEPPGDEAVPLPAPRELPARALDEVMLDRRTCRNFDGSGMTVGDLATLLGRGLEPVRAARERGRAGPGLAVQDAAAFPFGVWPILARSPDLDPGAFEYRVEDHSLRPVEGDVGETPAAVDDAVRESAVGQEYVEGAAVTLLLTADLAAYRRRHPDPGALRDVFSAAAAHVHRLILVATAMGFDCFQSAAFDDGRTGALAGVDGFDERVVYLLTVGREDE